MLAVAITPGVLVGTTIAGAIEATGAVKLIAIAGGLLAAIATIVGIVYGAKWKSAYDVEHALMAAHADRADLMTAERDEARQKLEQAAAVLVDAQKTIARLEALPNLERVLELITETFTRLGGHLEELHHVHEEHAAERHRELRAAIRQH